MSTALTCARARKRHAVDALTVRSLVPPRCANQRTARPCASAAALQPDTLRSARRPHSAASRCCATAAAAAAAAPHPTQNPTSAAHYPHRSRAPFAHSAHLALVQQLGDAPLHRLA
eukprot:5122944-Prymnesium_polylepis.1